MSDEQAEKERIQRILEKRIQSQYGGTASKLKYNTGLKSKHHMTRNTKALPGFGDLPRSAKGAIMGGIAGLVVCVIVYNLVNNVLNQNLLAMLVGFLVFLIMSIVGFILGKVIEQ